MDNKTEQYYKEQIEQLKDELDVANMHYLSTVSMYKSLYNELRKKVFISDTEISEMAMKKYPECVEAREAYVAAYKAMQETDSMLQKKYTKK